MYTKPASITKSSWQCAYERWLDGTSLAKLAKEMNLSQGRIVKKYFERHFGVGCCDLQRTSFTRSLRSDYPDSDYVKTLQPTSNDATRYYSQSALKNSAVMGIAKTKGNRSVEMSYRIAYQKSIHSSDDPWKYVDPDRPLSLYFVITWLQLVVSLLHSHIMSYNDV